MKKVLAFGPLFIVIAALLWSFDGVLRVSLYSLPPTVIVFWEHIMGAVILFLFVGKWAKDLPKMTKKEWGAMTLVALLSGALGTVLYTSALQLIHFTQFSVVVLLQQLQPISAILAASLLLREKITRKFLLYALLAISGAYLITFKNLEVNLVTGAGTALAGALALGAGLVWGSSTALSKVALNKVSFLTGTALRFLIAPIFAFLFILGRGELSDMLTLQSEQWWTLLLITFSTGMVALLFYYYGLKRTPARVCTLYELAWPASAIFIDYFMFGNTLSATQFLGIAVLVVAVYMATKEAVKSGEEIGLKPAHLEVS
ncbi:MAG: EamA family transporter [Candidatus Vogelbacteria bacterium CG10_big_fil_rev_8_21_14_0_10_45_14]|uniref:EamA family transporter n=1 Tax=Candidatus Vogelbacteria bacterium CG10_big_fil_rev_8_21_14_0_10_45_14 TaxID=1975042 RepID=A0A2H0RK90_9BACT|nr:MAG: EamA family transporter [Candidatus Vogelbacteria bacterium CG10_big_fil_rev_8_21_14_0_10_45_14]